MLERVLTVAVCTHNRAHEAIASIKSVMESGSHVGVDFVLVDSASDADDAEILREFCGRDRRVKRVRLDEPGLSAARNVAARKSPSAWIAYIDDDARCLSGWLDRAVANATMADPACAIVGGRIDARWPVQRPAYVGERWLMFLSCIEREVQDGSRPQVFGANIMFRRAALLGVRGFPIALGRRGDLLLSGEESFVEHLLLEEGWQMRYDGSMGVDHIIDQSRLTPQWVLKRAFWGGQTEVESARLRGLRSVHLNPLRATIAWLFLWIRSRAVDPYFDFSIRAAYARGIVLASLRSARGGA